MVWKLHSRRLRFRFFIRKEGDESSRARVEPRDIDFFLPKGEKSLSLLVLFFLIFATFSPLAIGKNFLPFGRYPQWSIMLAQSSDQELAIDSPAIKRLEVMPWAEEPEVSSIAINWAENLHFAREMRNGRIPLWDPYAGCGGPTVDNGQSRPFNPFRLPFYLFPTTWMYSLTLLAGLVFGCIGIYSLLSKQGLSPPAVTLGTGLFVLNPWVLDRLALTDVGAYFVLPWCLLTLERAFWRNWSSIARAILCFVLMGCLGHPEVSLVMAGVAASFYLFNDKPLRKHQESFAEKLKIVGVVAGFTLACLTVLWLPPLRLFLIGDIYKKHALFTYPQDWRSLVALPSNMFVSPTIFAVLLPAFFAWERIPRFWVVVFIIILLVLFPLPWVGLGLSGIITSLGLPSLYLAGVFWVSLSFLAAFGLDAYRISKKSIVVAASIFGGVTLALAGWQFASLPLTRSDISVSPGAAFLLFGLGLFALIALCGVRKRLVIMLLPAIFLAPLAFPLSLNKQCWNSLDFKTNSVIEWLKTYLPNSRTVSMSQRNIFAIPPNLSQAYGIRSVELMAVIFLNNYWSMFHHPQALMPTAVLFNSYTDFFKDMGASVLLLSNDALLNDLSEKGLGLLVRGTRFSAYSIPGAHGRLYFAERVLHYRSDSELTSQVLSLGRDTDALALVEDMGNPVSREIPEVPSAVGKAVFEMDDAEEILVRTECPLEGLLVLRDSWYPGWVATIDGKRTPILRVNGCFRGVIVSAGIHKIRFSYRPILVYISGGVSLLTILVVIFVSIRKTSTPDSTD